MGININPKRKGNPVGRLVDRRTSIFVVMVISIIPLTSMFVYHLNPQITTDNPKQYQTDSGQYAYVVPNDGTPDTEFYFTYRDGSCIFTDYAESQGLWTSFTWHNTFWCVSGEEIMHRTPNSPDSNGTRTTILFRLLVIKIAKNTFYCLTKSQKLLCWSPNTIRTAQQDFTSQVSFFLSFFS